MFVKDYSISKLLNNTTKKLFKGKGFEIFKLIEIWPEIIGKDLSDSSMPISLFENNGTKTLEIEITNPAIILNFQYEKDDIIKKINDYFGNNLIQDLKLKTTSHTKQKKSKQTNPIKISADKKTIEEINSIEDEELQKKLLNMINQEEK
jgi:hypothetical protein